MKQVFRLLSVVIFLITFTFNLIAQAPEGVNYQAIVRDNAGQPLLSQPVDVRFTIRQTNPTGVVVFQEVHSTNTNQFGLVNLRIGSVNTTAFPTINWGVGTYFLQVEVDPGTGYEDLGATQLISVPYALYAKTAGNGPQGLSSLMDTTSAGALCPNGGYQVDMGLDANSNMVLDAVEITNSFVVCNGVDGAANVSDTSSTNELQTISISNDTVYLTNGGFIVLPSAAGDNDWVVNGSEMYSDPSITGHVGIGTTTPASKLHIETAFNGGDGILINNTNPTGNVGLEFQTQSNPRFVLGVDQNDNNKFKIAPTNAFTNTRFTINQIGNVGIGTITPTHKLTTVSTDTIIANFVGTNPGGAAISIAATNPNAVVGTMFLTGSDSGVVALDPTNKTMFVANTTSNGHIGLFADSSTALYGMQVANIASDIVYNQTRSIYNEVDTIYSFSPSSSVINVNQGSFLTDSLYVLGNNAGNLNWILANDGLGQAVWTDPSTLGLGGGLWQSNTPDIYFNTGNVGIGTTTPTEMLHIESQAAPQDAVLKLSAGGLVGPTTGINFSNSISSSADIVFEPGVSDDLILRNNVSGAGFADIIFQTGGANDRMVIDENGNVGIGTSTPSSKLTINSGVGTEIEFVGGFNADIYSNAQIFMSSFGPTIIDASEIRLGTATFDRLTVLNNGNVGIGTITPGSLLEVTGLTTTDSLIVTTGAGTAGNVLTDDGTGNAVWTAPSGGSLWQSNTPDIFFNTGFVGIGTNTPSSALHVNGQITVADGSFATPAFIFDGTSTGFYRGAGDRIEFVNGGLTSLQIHQNQLRVKRGSLAAPGVVWSDETTTGIYGSGANDISFVNSGAESMRIDGNGNVGIGTDAPYVKLHVAADSSVHIAAQASNSIAADEGANLSLLRSRGSIAAPSQVLSGDRLGKVEFIGYDNTSNFVEAASIRAIADENFGSTNHGTHLEFHTSSIGGGGGEVMRLTENGFVGVGTPSPTSKLHILNGTMTIDNGANPYTLPTADGAANQVLQTDGAGNVSWANSGGGSAWLLAGNSGTSPATDAIGTLDAQDLVFMTNGGERMRMTAAGRIGIGITNPISPFNLIYNGTDQEGMLINYTNSTAASSGMGFFVAANNTGTAPIWAAGVQVTSSGNSTETVGLDALNTASGLSNFGVRSSVGGTGTTNYGFYSEVSGAATNWAAYFANGNVFVGDTIVIPTNAGAGKVLTSDAAGNGVWKPKQVGFMARPAGTGQAFGAGAFIDFTVTDFNDGGFYNTAASEFVAPAPGVYHFTANVDVQAGGFATAHMVMYKNGGQILGEVYENVQGGNRYSLQISVTVQLNAGDQINLYMDAGGGPSVQIQSLGGTSFSGHLVYAY